MIGGLDDGDDPHGLVALEAMAGLVKLLGLVEPWDLRTALLHMAIRIRPFFDSVGWWGVGGGDRTCPLFPWPLLQASDPALPPAPQVPGTACGHYGSLPSREQAWGGP